MGLVPALYLAGLLSLGWAIGLGVLALMMLAASLLGVCSIYYRLGYSTCPAWGKPNSRG